MDLPDGRLVHCLAKLAALDTADRLFLFNTLLLALAHKPALVANGAQHPTLDNFFAKTSQQLILRFVWAYNNNCQVSHLPSW